MKIKFYIKNIKKKRILKYTKNNYFKVVFRQNKTRIVVVFKYINMIHIFFILLQVNILLTLLFKYFKQI